MEKNIANYRPHLYSDFAHLVIAEDMDGSPTTVSSYKKRAGLGQWKTPPHTFYPFSKRVPSPHLPVSSHLASNNSLAHDPMPNSKDFVNYSKANAVSNVSILGIGQ